MSVIDKLNLLAGKVVANTGGNLATAAGRSAALHYALQHESELHALAPNERRHLAAPVGMLNLATLRACQPDVAAETRAQWLAVVAVLTLLVRSLTAEDATTLMQKQEGAVS